MYVNPNFRTKRELRDAVKAGRPVNVYQPGLGETPSEGWASVEGPHYPKPHTWYAEVRLEAGLVKAVR